MSRTRRRRIRRHAARWRIVSYSMLAACLFCSSLSVAAPVTQVDARTLQSLAPVHRTTDMRASARARRATAAKKKTVIKTAHAQAPGLPVRVRIAAIDVDAKIVPLGLLPDGKLDAPANAQDVGWYNLNAKPGDKGNAILDGHLTLGRGNGVFWDLNKLEPGDTIEVTDELGVVRLFRVKESRVYPVDAAPMETIFGPTKKRNLNIITCAGVWRTSMNHYDKRLIVYTELVETETL